LGTHDASPGALPVPSGPAPAAPPVFVTAGRLGPPYISQPDAAFQPASMGKSIPVIAEASSDTRNAMPLATSTGSTQRPSAACASGVVVARVPPPAAHRSTMRFTRVTPG